MQHTLNVTRDITRSMKDLESDIVELEEMSESTGDRGCIEILKVKKLALANLLESKVQGALVRSRLFQNIAEMDTPSGFFFGLERKNGQKKVIHTLLSDTGQELVEPGQIRRRAVEFYRSLYSSEYEEDNTLQEEFCSGLPQVSTETNSRLAEPLRLCELQAALQSMQGQRAPGIDGLTVEFYKAFWDILAADILDVFNESLTYGSMPVSCRRAVLTLLPKKGNLQDIKNWRPVSLLCVDYKLLSKALANRLREAMEQVIHRDQTYCVPGSKRNDKPNSLHWLLKEPLIHGARLDISSSVAPGLTAALCRSRTLSLQQLVDAVGPALGDAEALSSLLSLHSVRVAGRILSLWRQKLSGKERSLLIDSSQGKIAPNPADSFPDVCLSPELGDLTGPLLAVVNPDKMTVHKVDKKTLYNNCVKSINKKGLSNRPPTVWTQKLSEETGPSPQWKFLYKPPLKKRTADLQWRILHGAIASNAFISVLNPAVSSKCPFCGCHETIFHVFIEPESSLKPVKPPHTLLQMAMAMSDGLCRYGNSVECCWGWRQVDWGRCQHARTCYHANCQYGCEVIKGAVRCTCLRRRGYGWAQTDAPVSTSSECVSGGGVCPRHRKCVNTFGSFVCKCHLGFKLTYISGRYACIDKDSRPFCSLNPSSPKCRCKDGSCKAVLKVTVQPQKPRTTRPTPARTTTPTTTTTAAVTTTIITTATPVPMTTTTPTTTATTETTTSYNTYNYYYYYYCYSKYNTYYYYYFPRHPNNNQVWEFDIELGNTAEDAKDDPEVGVLRCTFDHGLCDWMSDREGDLHWTTNHSPAGGSYLSVPELKAGQRSIRGARLAIQIVPPWSHGDLCFSFSHWLTGHHVGVLQLFIRKKGRDQRYSSALWSRTGGHGWRETQVTLTTHSLDKVLLKAEWRKGRRGQGRSLLMMSH
ncbi:hypothetical protein L3Q82_003739 [Scortum barcoo]|uniref:Uncharacterized protein n=1 Tax=Scortum barcoo TaxID=214431 RepID=A0ACB8X7D3_9TELE|nr:hypothetical protein L3Q82_003739 [Scortum barcoo]